MSGRSTLSSWSGHLDAVTCHAPLTWVGSSVSSILTMELKLTACPVVIDIIIVDIMNKQFFFSPLYLCVNKLSECNCDFILLVHGVNKWFQAARRDCFCYPLCNVEMNLPHLNHFESELLLASLPSYTIQLFGHLTCNDDAAGLIVSTYRGKNCFQILGMALHGNNSGKAKKTGHLLLPWVSMWLLSAISLKEIMALGFNGRAVLFLAMMCAFMEGPDLIEDIWMVLVLLAKSFII